MQDTVMSWHNHFGKLKQIYGNRMTVQSPLQDDYKSYFPFNTRNGKFWIQSKGIILELQRSFKCLQIWIMGNSASNSDSEDEREFKNVSLKKARACAQS